ncbi:hypothetical protein HWV62_10477 [Athelia sp. TMB]|nr:hypothetical protein HWV62_10477 [Athelia sp. TMB]
MALAYAFSHFLPDRHSEGLFFIETTEYPKDTICHHFLDTGLPTTGRMLGACSNSNEFHWQNLQHANLVVLLNDPQQPGNYSKVFHVLSPVIASGGLTDGLKQPWDIQDKRARATINAVMLAHPEVADEILRSSSVLYSYMRSKAEV